MLNWWPGRQGFFFSSRRRHTSSLRDWSSDVCSSDLGHDRDDDDDERGIHCASSLAPTCSFYSALLLRFRHQRDLRSEERRVGKEWIDRWIQTLEKREEEILENRDARETSAAVVGVTQ